MVTFELKDIGRTSFNFIHHGLQFAFVERWDSESSCFHLSFDEMSITLNNVSCLFYFPIRDQLFDHSSINRVKALTLMVQHLRDNIGKAGLEISQMRETHTWFGYLKTTYELYLIVVVSYSSNDALDNYNKHCVFFIHFSCLVKKTIFVDKNATYVDILYVCYFIDF